MKKLTSLALSAVMAVSLLAGCGSQAGSAATGTDNPQANTSSTAADSEEVYNVVMQWPSLGNTPAGLIDVENAINEITVPAIGCSVTLLPGNAFTLANDATLAVSSGEKLDLCLALFSGVGSLVNSGSILPLDDYMEEYGQAITDANGIRMAGGMYDGHLYAAPISYLSGEKYGYVCRTDILDKYNIQIDPDKVYSMDEMGEIFATVSAGEGPGFYCIGGTNASSNLFENFYAHEDMGSTNASGTIIMKDFSETTIVNEFATPEYEAYAKTMYDWAQKGYFIPDASTNTDEGSMQVAAGNVLGYFAGTCSGGAADYNTQTGYDMTIITTIDGYSATNMFNVILWCVPSTSERPEKAVQFLNYIYENQDVCNLLAFGIEGTDYVVVEDNGTDKLIDYPEGLNNTTVPYYQMFGVYGQRMKWLIRVPNSIDYNNNLRQFDASIEHKSPALGYVFKVDDVSTQYSAVSAVISQYVALFSTGAANPESELPKFIKALEDAGINEVISANQEQLDAFLAAQ